LSAVTYALHGTTVGFDRAVGILHGAETDEPAALHVHLRDPRTVPAPRHWTVRWDDDGSLRETEDDEGPWLRFRGAFDVHVVGSDLVTRVRAGHDLAARGVVDLVVPMVRCDEGALALHAAGFAGPAGATLLLGPNGAGKSTLTAIAAAAGRRILADDCVVVDLEGGRAVAHRGVPSIGMTPSVAAALGVTGAPREDDDEDKLDVALTAGQLVDGPVPVQRIVVLGERWDGDTLEAAPVGGGTALAELAEQCHAGVRGTLPAVLLEQLATLVEAVPVVRARVPEGLDVARAALEASGW
jgi:hypothetical protein